MRGFVPPAVTDIKPFRYEVGVGDDPGSIAEAFTGDPWRYHELVGANRGIPLGAPPQGARYRTFGTLAAGTQLCIPASWCTPWDGQDWPEIPDYNWDSDVYGIDGKGGQGGIGVGVIPGFNLFGNTISSEYDNLKDVSQAATTQNEYQQLLDATKNIQTPTVSMALSVSAIETSVRAILPTASQTQARNVATVLLSWWPLFPTQLKSLSSALPLNLAAWAQAGETKKALFIDAIASANKLLSVENTASATVLAGIPWDQVDWSRIPWGQIKEHLPNRTDRINFWNLLSKLAPATSTSSSSLLAPSPVNPITTQWGSLPLSNVEWNIVPWSQIDWLRVNSSDIWRCLTPDRINRMRQNEQCLASLGWTNVRPLFCSGDIDAACQALREGRSDTQTVSTYTSTGITDTITRETSPSSSSASGSKKDEGKDWVLPVVLGTLAVVGGVFVLSRKGR